MVNKFLFSDVVVKPGERRRINIPVDELYDHTEMSLPIEVIRGKEDGPTLFISAAIHGDEICGTEIVRRILSDKVLKSIRGTLIAVPVVNVYGFNTLSRYLPDRRDLNRMFPGSEKGSLAGRLAHIFMREIVDKCSHGIDLHSGSNHRKNFPQIRACLDDAETKKLALKFGTPVIINSTLRDGSLRQAALEKGIPMLLFEGGGALRFSEPIIRAGVNGIKNVMASIGMIEAVSKTKKQEKQEKVYISNETKWLRSPVSGIVRNHVKLGAHIKEGQRLAVISGPFGANRSTIRSTLEGILIGCNNLPLVNGGDALFHIATFRNPTAVKGSIEEIRNEDLEDLEVIG